MQQKEEVSFQSGWFLFTQQSGIVQKKFWEKQKQQPESLQIQFSGTMSRIGKKHQTPKQYYFLLDHQYNLYYYKNEKKKVPKGMIRLNQYIQISLRSVVIKEQKFIAIQFQKAPKVTYTIFSLQKAIIFDWWLLVTQVCTISNYDDLYLVIEQLGKGSFATVFKVKRLIDSKIFAAKYYYKDTYISSPNQEQFFVIKLQKNISKHMIKNETSILRELQHSCIIKVHEVHQQSDKIVIIMDYVPGRDLYQLIKRNKRISEKKSAILMYQLIDALLAMKNLNYAHRDLKLENILIEDNKTLSLKIVDFGFAEKMNPNELTCKSGTPGYIAPEVYHNQPYTDKGDVFSLGIILYSMICGYSPFRGDTYQKIMEENKNALLSFDRSVWKEVSKECKDLIRRMAEPDPQLRISFDKAMEHPWIVKQYFAKQSQAPISISENKSGEYLKSDIFKSFDFKIEGAPRSFYRSNLTMKQIDDKLKNIVSINDKKLSMVNIKQEKSTSKITKVSEFQSKPEVDLDFLGLEDKVDSQNLQFLKNTFNVFHVNKQFEQK